MLINSIESLVRDGYQIHVVLSGEVYVYFTTDSQTRQHEVWNRDKALIDAFLGGRQISGYCYMSVRPVAAFSPEPVAKSAPVPTSKPAAVTKSISKPATTKSETKPVAKSASKPATKPVTKPVPKSVAEPVLNRTPVDPDTSAPATPAFKPSLTYCAELPAQSTDFLEVLGSDGDEYVIYAKTDNTFHIHWKVTRDHAKEVWLRDRSHIQQWLGADANNLNTVSWDELVDNGNLNAKWKEVSPETTKLSTVLRQVVSFGKRIADLAILEDGSHHVYFYLSRQEAKQAYLHVKSEFGNYPITSVSFES